MSAGHCAPREFSYRSMLTLPPSAARSACAWLSELSACARAVILGHALDAATARARTLGAHLADLVRARARVAQSPHPAASVPMHYADRAIESTARASADVRRVLDHVIVAIEVLIPDVERIAVDAQRVSEQLKEQAPGVARSEEFKALCFRELHRRLTAVASGDLGQITSLPLSEWPELLAS